MQGSKCVKDYYKEMEMTMVRANVNKDREATMTQLLNGLNKEIAHVVELQHYVELDDWCIWPLRWKGNLSKKEYLSTTLVLVHPTNRVGRKRKRVFQRKQSRTKTAEDLKGKGKAKTQSSRNSDIKCFKCLDSRHITSQCPNKRVMVLSDNIVESEREGDKSMVETEEESDEVEYTTAGKALVTRCVLNSQVKEDDMEQRRENIFHTRFLINNKVCSIIIDGGSCTIVASTTLVEKLNLLTIKHPKPYKL